MDLSTAICQLFQRQLIKKEKILAGILLIKYKFVWNYYPALFKNIQTGLARPAYFTRIN